MVLIETVSSYPNMISQCTEYNGSKYNSWSNLDKVKIDEKRENLKVYDLCGVCYNVSNAKSSALLYAYDFNFNIPLNAVIEKVALIYKFCSDDITKDSVKTNILKLKVGASISDMGVGNNLDSSTIWKTRSSANKNGMQIVTLTNNYPNVSVKDYFGITLTPSLINSRNFGFILQAIGTGANKHKIYVDNMRIEVSYSLPDDVITVDVSSKSTKKLVENTVVDNTSDTYHIETRLSAVKYNTLNPDEYTAQTTISQPYDVPYGYKFWIRYKNYAITKNGKKIIPTQRSNPVYLTTDGNTVFKEGKSYKIVQSKNIEGTSDSRYFKSDNYPLANDWIEKFYEIYVYPNITDFDRLDSDNKGFIESTVRLYNTTLVDGEIVKNKLVDSITFKLTSSNSNISNSQCIIEDCIFESNKAYKGSAVYNTGRMYSKNVDLRDNVSTDTCQFFDADFCRDKELV